MRLLQVLVSSTAREDVLARLDEDGIDYVVTEEASDDADSALVSVPLPTQAVEEVFEWLQEAGVEDEYVVVSSIETARTPGMSELEEKYVNGSKSDDSVFREEIRTRALNMTPGRLTYYAMTVVSAVVATAGLLLDSPAIVVGSMVIAPQVSAALTGTVGTVMNDREMIVDGLASLAAGLAVAIGGAFAFAWLLRSGAVVPTTIDITAIEQVRNRVSPGLLALVVGVGAGAAAAFGLSTALPVSLVGVMIAAALIPAAAAVGIGLAWGSPAVALGAGVLVAINAASIVLSGLVVFWYLGYRPPDWTAGSIRANLAFERVGAGAVSLAVLTLVFLGAGTVLYQHVAFENAVNEETRTVLDDDRYEELELVALEIEFVDVGREDDTEVTVVLRRPADAAYPTLVGALEGALAERTGRDVTVVVEYVERAPQRRLGAAGPAQPSPGSPAALEIGRRELRAQGVYPASPKYTV